MAHHLDSRCVLLPHLRYLGCWVPTDTTKTRLGCRFYHKEVQTVFNVLACLQAKLPIVGFVARREIESPAILSRHASTRSQSKLRNIWIRDVFCAQYLWCWCWVPTQTRLESSIKTINAHLIDAWLSGMSSCPRIPSATNSRRTLRTRQYTTHWLGSCALLLCCAWVKCIGPVSRRTQSALPAHRGTRSHIIPALPVPTAAPVHILYQHPVYAFQNGAKGTI